VRRSVLAATVATAIALAGPVATAQSDERVVAIPQSTYATQNVAIDEGEPLTFLNLDVLSHDVTARDEGANGRPLFSTPLIGTGQEVPVEGADSVAPGEYPFFCTIHPNMEGTLTVGGGDGGGGGGGDGANGAPEVELEVLDSKVSQVRKAGVLRVEMTVDRAASMSVSASVKAGGEKSKLGKDSHDLPEGGSHVMEVKLSKRGKSALRGANKAKVTVTGRAKDSAGNTGKGKASKTLR
jgi:plastocyanin